MPADLESPRRLAEPLPKEEVIRARGGRGSRQVLFRRSPWLVSYWDAGGFVVENYATRARVSADPLASQILDFFGEWRTVDALALQLRSYRRSSLREAVSGLAAHTLLERSDRAADPRTTALASWSAWNPHAGLFHFGTKDVPYNTDPDTADRWLRRKARREPPPPPLKRLAGARRTALPPPRLGGEFTDVLLARRTWRSFSRRALDLGSLATLLGITWRVQGWMDFGSLGKGALKTSPSGGARHVLEAYVLVRRVRGLAPGLYHYEAGRHRLALVRRGLKRGQIAAYLPTQWWYGAASAVVLMTAVFPRSQWKYGFPRAYRTVLIEAGHFCQTFLLVATWLGLAPFCSMALADSAIERDLGVDGVTESVLYAAGVGTRPAGVSWAPWPPQRSRRPSPQ